MRVGRDEDVALIRFQSPDTYTIFSFAKAEVMESCTTVGYSMDTKLFYPGYVVTTTFDNEYIVANGGLFPGCSGGVLLNTNGEAIGITVAVPIYHGSALDSTGLYVPIRFAKALMIMEEITGD